MTPYQIFITASCFILVTLYIIYLVLKRRELEEEDTTLDKVVLALKELGKQQPSFGEYLHKIGLF